MAPGPPPRIRAVLFDLGGTLLSERDYDGWVRLAAAVGLTVDPEGLAHAFTEVERELDRPLPLPPEWAYWQAVLSRADGHSVTRAQAEGFVAGRLRSTPPMELFSDVRRCLEELKADGKRLGVVSNSRGESHVRMRLEQAGILSYFSTVVSSGTEGVAKPDPEIFRRAVERMGVRPEEAFYVGNLAYTDAKAARAAGLHSVWLNRDGTGFGDDPPEVTSLTEVPKVIAELERRPLR